MSHLTKALRLLATVFLRLVRYALLLILVIAIPVLILIGVLQIVYALSHWNGGNWQESLSLILIGVIVLTGTPMMVFRLFGDRPWAKQAAGWYRQRVHMLYEVILAPLIAWGVFIGLVIVFALIWALLLFFSGREVISNNAFWYLIGTFAVLTFIFVARGATQRMMRWIIGPRLELPWLMSLLRPSLMRVYGYALLALIYFLSTFEDFAGGNMTGLVWWESVRPIIVAILLTYVTIDGAFVALRDHREAVSERLNNQQKPLF